MPPKIAISPQDIAKIASSLPPDAWIGIGIGGMVLLFWLVRKLVRLRTIVGLLALAALAVFLITQGQGVIAQWQRGMLRQSTAAQANTATPVLSSNPSAFVEHSASGAQAANASNPILHESPWLLAAVLVVMGLWILGWLVYKALPGEHKRRLRAQFTAPVGAAPSARKGNRQDEFDLPGIELAVERDSGRPIRIDGKDRFLNALVVGSIGTGKTSRILSKAAYQDLMAISRGVPLDVIVQDPDGGLVESVADLARSLGIEVVAINLRGDGGVETNVSFNPFGSGDTSDIIDNIRAVIREQMGDQEAFFQNAQDDLIRTVIQVQVPIWPDTNFLHFSELVTDPMRFRGICAAAADEKVESEIIKMHANEIQFVQERMKELNPLDAEMVQAAARSFMADTRTPSRMESLEKITKGLKIVVSELSTNRRLREVLGHSDLPVFDFARFFQAGREEPGRLVAITTGNRPVGNLFGRLFLVSLKMHALSRPGSEWTRRPTYVYVDEFARFATASLGDWFSQGRKYRTAAMLAIQTRAQLVLREQRRFVDVVEGSCRNKVYFPGPSPEDARELEKALGSVQTVKETHSKNNVSWVFDSRGTDRKVSEREEVEPRYRMEHLLYGLQADEAIFVRVVDNKVLAPTVGKTSYADAWLRSNGGKKWLKSAVSSKRVQAAKAEAPAQEAVTPVMAAQAVEAAPVSRFGVAQEPRLVIEGADGGRVTIEAPVAKRIEDRPAPPQTPQKAQEGEDQAQEIGGPEQEANGGEVVERKRLGQRRDPFLCGENGCTATMIQKPGTQKLRCPKCGHTRKLR